MNCIDWIIIIITGAKGTVNAGLVPLCVEKLVQEENSQLKVLCLCLINYY